MFVIRGLRAGIAAVVGLVALAFLFALPALASVPGSGATLAVSPSGGSVNQSFDAVYTGGTQHCTGQGWSMATFYLDGSPIGRATRGSGCSATLIVTPASLSPVPAAGTHLVTVDLVNPGGQVAPTGLSAYYTVAGSPPPPPSPSPTPSDSPTPTPTPAASPAPGASPTPTPGTGPTPAPPGTVVAPSPGPSSGPTDEPTPGPVAAAGTPPPAALVTTFTEPGSSPEVPSTSFNALPGLTIALGLLALMGLVVLARRAFRSGRDSQT